MLRSFRGSLFAISLCVLGVSCGRQPGIKEKETIPVCGVILVDGKPVGNLVVTCENLAGIDKENPTASGAFTQEDGRFRITTYRQGDGVPVGEYALTCVWNPPSVLSGRGGYDKLHGRYATSEKCVRRFKVEKGSPVDLGRIDLTTK